METTFLQRYKNVIIFVAVFLFAFFGTKLFMSKDEKIDEKLKADLKEYNKKCPIPINDSMRVDSVSFLGNKTIRYNTVLFSLDKDAPESYISVMKGQLKKASQDYLDTNPEETKPLKEMDVTLNYYYRDIHDNYLFDYTLKAKK